MQNVMSSAEDTFAEENSETIGLLPNNVVGQEFQYLLGYNALRTDGSNVEETAILISGLDAWVATAVRCAVKKENHGRHRRKKCDSTYGLMLQNITR